MPDFLIPIGFGLDGYTVSSNAASGATSSGNSYDIFSSGSSGISIEDGKWVQDDSLKQTTLTISQTLFGNFPIKLTKDSSYSSVIDNINVFNIQYTTVNAVVAAGKTCPYISHEGITGSQGSDDKYKIGIAVSAKRINEYITKFYPNTNISTDIIIKMISEGLLNAEIVFSKGQANGKVFNFKIIHNAEGRDEGEVIFSSALFAIPKYQYIGILNYSKLGVVIKNDDSSSVSFPIRGAYNYKTGTIDGFSYSGVKAISSEWKTAPSELIKETKFNIHAQQTCRVRFFIDATDKVRVQQLVSNLPDDIFKTNYSENEDVVTEQMITGGDVNNRIVKMAETICAYLKGDGKYLFTYRQESNACCQVGKTDGWPFEYGPRMTKGTFISRYKQAVAAKNSYTNENSLRDDSMKEGVYWGGKRGGPTATQKMSMCCGSFVSWILAEAGIGDPSGAIKTLAGSVTDKNISLRAGYRANYVPSIKEAIPGDILVFSGHVAIFGGLSPTGSCTEWGGGNWWRVGGVTSGSAGPALGAAKPQPCVGTQNPKGIIRISEVIT